MAKDINIHIKTRGAAQTKQQLEEVGKKSRQVGDKTAEGHKEGAAAVEKTTRKMTGMGRILGNLKSQVFGFFGAWLGIQSVERVVNWLIEKLEKIQRLQKEIYEKSVSLTEIGQTLETQTGTVGKQQWWAQQALQLQAAGGLASPEVAEQMMMSMDIAFQKQGGIRNRQIQELAKQLAPFVGAAGYGPEEVSKLFKFAGTAGIAPTEEAYKEYFAKLLSAYRASESTEPGLFLTGLQKGGTAYMAMGGTLEETLSAYSAAIAVTASEALAATLVEQIARLSAGAYEKPRKAIEQKLGVTWEKLSMDKRMQALLRYVESVPEASRGEVLAEQGFPVELSTQIGKMVSPKAKKTMESTREKVANATIESIELTMKSYMDSILAEHRKAEAQRAEKVLEAGPAFMTWQERLKDARQEFDITSAQGQDRWLRDSIEPQVLAIESLIKDLDKIYKTTSEEQRPKVKQIRDGLESLLSLAKVMSFHPIAYKLGLDKRLLYKIGQKGAEAVEILRQAERTPTPVEPPVKKTEAEAKPETKETPPVQPVAKETQVEVPVRAVAKEVPAGPIELDVPVEVQPQEGEVPVRAVAKVVPSEPVTIDVEAGAEAKQVEVPVRAVAKVTPAGPVTVDVDAEAEGKRVDVPIRAVAKVTPAGPVTVDVDAEAEGKRVDVPIQAVAKVTPAEPVTVDVDVEAEGKRVDVPIRAVAKEIPAGPVQLDVEAEAETKQVEVPVQGVAKEIAAGPVTVDVEAEAEAKQVEVPIEAVAKEVPAEPVTVDVEAEAEAKQVEVPVQAVAKEVPAEPVTVDVDAEAEAKQVDVPVRAVAKEITPGVTFYPGAAVDVEAEARQVEVPVQTVAKEIAAGPVTVDVPVEVAAKPPMVSVPAQAEEQTTVAAVTNIFHYHYDHSLRYYPRVGSDESGPRVEPGVVV